MSFIVTSLADMDPDLARDMFLDRAEAFVHRLGWEQPLTDDGLEIDQYDDEDSLYVVRVDPDNPKIHLASQRLRSCAVPIMANEFFLEAMGGDEIHNPRIAENTRFLTKPSHPQGRRCAAESAAFLHALLGSGHWDAVLAVFDPAMLKVYAMQHNSPSKVLNPDSDPMAGLWLPGHDHLIQLCDRLRLDIAQIMFQAEPYHEVVQDWGRNYWHQTGETL